VGGDELVDRDGAEGVGAEFALEKRLERFRWRGSRDGAYLRTTRVASVLGAGKETAAVLVAGGGVGGCVAVVCEPVSSVVASGALRTVDEPMVYDA